MTSWPTIKTEVLLPSADKEYDQSGGEAFRNYLPPKVDAWLHQQSGKLVTTVVTQLSIQV